MNQTRCDNCLKKFGRNMQISDRTGRIHCTDCTFFGREKVERPILKDREENSQQTSQQEIETQQEKEQENKER
jgi:ribosome-binding protein aMBF1 (putative translation factor)